ncbi:MAG: rhodanese-like domain-containing protein [Chitinophagia bacterium]|jgi:rhodanese-related sulfurtransferase|nr:rhodanese-like domain-containing protein [Chitinophagia bacterium]NCA29196.1 rhodanese-like domain-containing protein [Chitinophagia bacterium]NDD17145.1 rhodanese-like domain-containing protein [Chitinophagia bacterium]
MQLSLAQFLTIIEDESVIIIDARPIGAFMQGYVPNAIHITPLTAKYAIAMDIIKKDSPLVFILEESIASETLAYFTKAEFTGIKGYLEGGFASWAAEKRYDLIIDVEIDELAMDIPYDEYLMVLDCRTEEDFDKSHIKNSVSLPLADMGDPGSMSELDEHFNIYIITENGDNSSLAASLLKKQGIHNIRVVVGGWEAVQSLKENFSFEVTKVKPASDEDALLN